MNWSALELSKYLYIMKDIVTDKIIKLPTSGTKYFESENALKKAYYSYCKNYHNGTTHPNNIVFKKIPINEEKHVIINLPNWRTVM